MYYTIRPAGPRTRKELFQYYLLLVSQLVKWLFCFVFSAFVIIAFLTKNYGAVAVLGLLLLTLIASMNFLNLRRWVPGLGKGSWFTKIIAGSIYVFLALAILLITGPNQP